MGGGGGFCLGGVIRLLGPTPGTLLLGVLCISGLLLEPLLLGDCRSLSFAAFSLVPCSELLLSSVDCTVSSHFSMLLRLSPQFLTWPLHRFVTQPWHSEGVCNCEPYTEGVLLRALPSSGIRVKDG